MFQSRLALCEDDRVKVAVARGHARDRAAVDDDGVGLGLGQVRELVAGHGPPVLLDVGDRREREVVLRGELAQVVPARHLAVLVADDLAERARGGQARQAREVHGRLRVAPALERAPGPRAQREEVARPAELVRGGLRVREGAERARAVARGDARRHVAAEEVHGDGERRALGVLVARDHGAEPQLVEPLAGHGDADDAGRVAHGEGQRLGRRRLRGEDEVALVLPVRVVRDDDGLAAPHRVERRLDGLAPEAPAVLVGLGHEHRARRVGGEADRRHAAGGLLFERDRLVDERFGEHSVDGLPGGLGFVGG